MDIEYSIDTQDLDQKEITDEIGGLIQNHSEIEKKQPKGALGVAEVATIIIAINASFQSAVIIGEKLGYLQSETDASVRVNDPEGLARDYISEQASPSPDQLVLKNRSPDGSMIEMEFDDGQGTIHIVRINPFDPDLQSIQYRVE